MLYGDWSANEGLMFLCDKEIVNAGERGIGGLLEENQ